MGSQRRILIQAYNVRQALKSRPRRVGLSSCCGVIYRPFAYWYVCACVCAGLLQQNTWEKLVMRNGVYSWELITPPLPVVHSKGAAAMIKDKIMLTGGYGSAHHKLTIGQQSWQSMAPSSRKGYIAYAYKATVRVLCLRSNGNRGGKIYCHNSFRNRIESARLVRAAEHPWCSTRGGSRSGWRLAAVCQWALAYQ